jgi:DNA-binding response OmpR family regulator
LEVLVMARILVVEDDPMLRGLILDVLRGSGRFQAYGAGSVAEAEAMFGQPTVRFAAVLLDTSLPDGDGNALCLKLREAGFKKPIVILTGKGGAEAEQWSLAHGASEHLTKPVTIARLLERLSALTATVEQGGQGGGAARRVPPRNTTMVQMIRW